MENARKALVVAGLAALALVLVWQIQTAERQSGQIQSIAQRQDLPVEEEVVNLPEDGNLYHISVVVHDDWQARPVDRQLVGLWSSDRRLLSLRAQTNYHFYTQGDATYQANLAHAIPDVPAVVVQDASGKVHYKASGNAVAEPKGILKNLLAKICPNCPRPGPKPNDTPAPVPTPQPVVPDTPVIPDTPFIDETETEQFPWALLVGVVVVAAGGSLVWQFRKELQGK